MAATCAVGLPGSSATAIETGWRNFSLTGIPETATFDPGRDGTWVTTDEGFEHGPPSSLAVLATGPDGVVVGGLASQAEDTSRRKVWGSADGATFRPTFEAPSSTWFVAGVRSTDQWFLYGTTTVGNHQQMTGWVASPDCATGAACGGVAALDQMRSSLTEMLRS